MQSCLVSGSYAEHVLQGWTSLRNVPSSHRVTGLLKANFCSIKCPIFTVNKRGGRTFALPHKSHYFHKYRWNKSLCDNRYKAMPHWHYVTNKAMPHGKHASNKQ